MKKILAVLLTVLLSFSLCYGVINAELIAAVANEAPVEEGIDQEAQLLEDSAVQATPDLEADREIEASLEQTAAQSTDAGLVEPTSSEGMSEEPYWVSDEVYSLLLSEYETAASAGDGTAVILDATLSVVALGSGIESVISVGGRRVLSSGTNAPVYDNASGTLLTPGEGLPTAGMSSDRSMLKLTESKEGAVVYEATFFFGSRGYPDAPFTALRTHVVLEVEAEFESEAEGEENQNSSGPDNAYEETVDGTLTKPDPEVLIDENDEQFHREIMPNTGFAALQNTVSPLGLWNIYEGYTFTSYLQWAGNWDGRIYVGDGYGGTYTCTMYWEGEYLTYYARCMNPGILGPESISYAGCPVFGRVTLVDHANQCVYVTLTMYGPAGYQNLIAWNVRGSLDVFR